MANEARLAGQAALVTGGGFGIGQAIAMRLAAEGARVAVLDKNPDTAAQTAEAISAAGGQALAVVADIREAAQIQSALEAAEAAFGPITILVNNAGGMAGDMSGGCLKDDLFARMDEEVWQLEIEVNLLGTMRVTKALLPGMIAAGRGSIINIASVAGVNGIPRLAGYSAAKGGVIAFTRALAMEVGRRGITVNCVSPGSIFTHGGSPETFLGRYGQPEEVASLAAFLASPEASFITGRNHVIDGGRCLSMKCYEVE